ncbi:hypothetical protein CGZ60_10265 [Neisseria animalis]|nr:hypothetical protein CGZ60_10265 [Neisseria animalis]
MLPLVEYAADNLREAAAARPHHCVSPFGNREILLLTAHCWLVKTIWEQKCPPDGETQRNISGGRDWRICCAGRLTATCLEKQALQRSTACFHDFGMIGTPAYGKVIRRTILPVAGIRYRLMSA